MKGRVKTLRLAMGEADRGLDAILRDGDQNAVLKNMQHRRDLYDLLRYEDYNHYDRDLFNFDVHDTPQTLGKAPLSGIKNQA